MFKEFILIIIISFVVLTSAFSLAEEPSFTVTLVEKSNGLEVPTKESGKTEYEVADMNHDGFLDIIGVGDHGSPNINSDQHGIMIWFGNGGSYWDVQQTGDFGYGGCAIGDLNLDGINDIVWGVHHNYSSNDLGDTILDAALGDGTGSSWINWSDGLATNGEDWGMFATDLADFDLDGDLDIVSESFGCCNGIHVYENHGDGSWSPQWSYPGGNVQYTLETADFNADGFPDFVCTHWDKNVYFGQGNFTFTNLDTGLPVGSINAVDIGDINHDGTDDLVCALGNNQGVRCYIYNQQTSSWNSYSVGLPSENNYYLIQCGDVNGDTNQDIIVYRGNTGRIYLGDGTGIWTSDASWTMPDSGDYSAMRVDGDVDFDMREDIIIQAKKTGFPFDENILRLYSPWLEPISLSGYVKTPHGGETFISGSIRFIDWLTAVPSTETNITASIYLSTSGATGPWMPIIEHMPNSGTYQWTVPMVNASTCRIKLIITTDTNTFETICSQDFTILNMNDTLIANAHGPYNAEPYQMVTFHGSATGGQAPYIWHWDFGDGTISSEQNPTHSYTDNNTYQVNLTVTDAQNHSDVNSTFAYIQDIIQPPQADFSYDPLQPYVNQAIQFTDLSTDNDGSIVNWSWDFGDGTTSYQQNPVHTYTNPNIYTVCVNVTDNEGYVGSICKDIFILYYHEQIDIEQTIQDRGFPIRHAADGDWGAAQNFIPTAINITKAEIFMRKFGSAEFNLTLELREDAINGPIIDIMTLLPDDVSTAWTWIEFDFPNVNITSSTTDYFIVCPPAPSGVTTSFGYEWGYAFGNQYDDGSFWFTRDGGNLWRDLPSMYEFTFRTYGYMPLGT